MAGAVRSPRSLPNFIRFLWIGILAVDLFVVGLISAVVVQNRQRATDQASAIAENYARTLEENFLGFIRKIDVILQATADEVARQQARGGIDTRELEGFLLRQDARIPEARGLRVVDVQGTIRYAVSGISARGANLADRPYFIRVRDDPGAGLVFSEPVMGRASQVPVITLSRRIEGPQASFAGEVNAAVGIDRLIGVLAVLRLGAKGSASLWSPTQLIARHAQDDRTGEKTGTPLPSPELRELIGSGRKADVYHITTRLDDVERIYQFRRVGDYPLYIVVGVADDDFLAEWRTDSMRMALLGALFLVGTAIFGCIAHLSWRQRERMQSALGEEKTKFEALSRTLEQRVAERALQLEAANRELEEFSYSMSHDMRAPLRAIDGFSKILLDDHGDELGADPRRMLSDVRRNAQRMGRMLDDMLGFLDLGRRRLVAGPIDMSALFRQAFEELDDRAPAGHSPRLDLRPLPPAWGDRDMIGRVVANLLSNAVKFAAPDRGLVVEVGAVADGPDVAYYVKDNGVGFDMRFAGKLFKVFERVHATGQYEGTAIGLAMVKRIVERHGGRVWAEGSVGGGATFFFTLGSPAEVREGQGRASSAGAD